VCECRTRSDRSTHFLFAVAHSAECARGMSHFGRTATWKTQDWCERQDRFGLDLRIKPRRGGVAVPTSKGGKAKGARGIPNSPVTVLRPEACRTTYSAHSREISLSGPESAGRLIPSVETPFPAMGPFHNNTVSLIIAFPFW
jgi:hypothetical protein